MSIHLEDFGYGTTEFWGSISTHHNWRWVDDDDNEVDESCPYYYTRIYTDKKGRKRVEEYFIQGDIDEYIHKYLSDKITVKADENGNPILDEDGNEIELYEDYPISDIVDDPSLVFNYWGGGRDF